MADKIIKAYLEGRIRQLSTAENVLFKLISNDKRVYKSGVKLYDKVMAKYGIQKPLRERLDAKNNKPRKFNVSGRIHILKTANKTNKTRR